MENDLFFTESEGQMAQIEGPCSQEAATSAPENQLEEAPEDSAPKPKPRRGRDEAEPDWSQVIRKRQQEQQSRRSGQACDRCRVCRVISLLRLGFNTLTVTHMQMIGEKATVCPWAQWLRLRELLCHGLSLQSHRSSHW